MSSVRLPPKPATATAAGGVRASRRQPSSFPAHHEVNAAATLPVRRANAAALSLEQLAHSQAEMKGARQPPKPTPCPEHTRPCSPASQDLVLNTRFLSPLPSKPVNTAFLPPRLGAKPVTIRATHAVPEYPTWLDRAALQRLKRQPLSLCPRSKGWPQGTGARSVGLSRVCQGEPRRPLSIIIDIIMFKNIRRPEFLSVLLIRQCLE